MKDSLRFCPKFYRMKGPGTPIPTPGRKERSCPTMIVILCGHSALNSLYLGLRSALNSKRDNMGSPPFGGTFCLGYQLITFLCAPLALLLCGCTHLYKPIYIPTKCDIPKLERPALGSSLLLENIKALLIYTELLEKDLEFCRKGNE